MSYPHFDQVQRAWNELIAEGKLAPRTVPDQVEADKGLLTQRAGYYSHQLAPAIGVLEKTEGNNYLGYSTDLLIRIDGTFWDVATDDSGGVPAAAGHPVSAVPVNGGPSGPDPALVPRWRKPTAELAQLPDGGTQPEPEPQPPADTAQILQAIADSEARVIAHQTSETDRVLMRLEELRQEVIHFAEQAGRFLLFGWWVRRRGEDQP